jgi:DNA-binding response OmpR family regulator
MRKLLIVDDNGDLLIAMQRLLSFYNFSVRTVQDPKNLIHEIASYQPEIILIDVLLSGEDGRQICKSLRTDRSMDEITLILFSASPKHLENFRECKADGIIEKPFAIKDLLEKIDDTVRARKDYLARRF